MISKKSHPTFNVPNFGAKNRKRVKERWRKQRGIDSKKRVKRSGYGAVPNIGYRNSDSVRGRRTDGTLGILVRNRKELDEAMKREGVSIILASGLSRRTRTELEKAADAGKAKIVNRQRMGK